MKDPKIQKIIEEINLRESKNYQKMDVKELSHELRETMDYERKIFSRIDDLEKSGTEKDLVNYARIIAKNTTGRQISEIQEIYLKKIDTEYLKPK